MEHRHPCLCGRQASCLTCGKAAGTITLRLSRLVAVFILVLAAALSVAFAQDPPAPAASSFTPQVVPEPQVQRANSVKPMPRVTAMPTPPPASAEPKKDAYATPKNDTAVALRTGWFDGRPTETITLRAAIEQALHNNLEVQFENTAIRTQRAQLRFALGAFDPNFSMNAQYQDTQRPTDISNPSTTQSILQQQQLQLQLNQAAQQLNIANQQLFQNQLTNQQQQSNINAQLAAQGIAPQTSPTGITSPTILPTQTIANPQLQNIIVLNQQGYQFQASLGGRLPIGTRYAIQDTLTRSRNTFSGDINPVNTLYENAVGISIQQPLLKSFGLDANYAEVRTARINERVQTLTWKNTISTAISNVIASYFDMDYALKDMQVREDAIAADSKLVDLYRRRVELGFGSPLDIQQAEVSVATSREALLASKNLFLERQFALKQLISHQFDTKDPRIFLPTNAPTFSAPRTPRIALLQQAFEKRYDYQALVLNTEVQDIRLKFAKNQLLPALDLVATYGLNGLGDASLGRSLNDTFGFEHPQYSIGFQFQIPIGNRQPKAQYDAILAQKEQAILRLKQREIDVGISVDLALSRIATLRQRADAARQTREFGEELVRTGYRRLEEGLISAYDITEQQRRLYDARTRELAALADLNKAVAQLWLATGTVLEQQGIVFDESPPGAKNAPLPKAELAHTPRTEPSKVTVKAKK
jgi:outer membrane protein TolC